MATRTRREPHRGHSAGSHGYRMKLDDWALHSSGPMTGRASIRGSRTGYGGSVLQPRPDCKLVVCDAKSVSDFDRLQYSNDHAFLYAFDRLDLNGTS